MSWTVDNKTVPPYTPPGVVYAQPTGMIHAMQPAGFPVQQPTAMMPPPAMMPPTTMMPQQQMAFADPQLHLQQQLATAAASSQAQASSMAAIQAQMMVNQAGLLIGNKECQHSWKMEYGIAGILVAIICFPIGLPAILCDRKEVCRKCAETR